MDEVQSTDHENSVPYYRLGAYKAVSFRRKSRVFGVLNIVLSSVLIFLGLLLLFSILPSNQSGNRSCYCPGPGSRCFWPFARRHPVLLISMDGFRHDYLETVRARLGSDSLPNFARLEHMGVRANRSINVFPTVTMPNHQTLITGLYPQHHGVVGNRVIDSKYPDSVFVMGNQTSLNQDPWLVGWPEPIWVTLQRAGGLAGSLLWPLTDQPDHKDLPFQQVSQFTLLDRDASRYSYRKRVNDLLWWLDNPRYNLDLILAYFDEPDETGHAYGPDSVDVANKVVELDTVLGWFLDGLDARNLLDKVDIILTADHGMAAISTDRLIPLNEYVNASDYTATQFSTFGFLYPADGKEQKVYSALRGANEHLQVYWLSEVPEYLHFNQQSSRTPPLVLVPDPYWYLVHTRNVSVVRGDHGFSTNFTDMHPFLIASGPSFLVNATVGETFAVDIYPLMCGLTRIRPRPNNGSLDRVAKSLLKPEVAERLLAFGRWPSWLTWLALEIELLWFLSVLTAALSLVVLLVLSMRAKRRYAVYMATIEDEHDDESVL